MNPLEEHKQNLTRRLFLRSTSAGLGTAALASVMAQDGLASPLADDLRVTHRAPKARSIIYLFMSGAPSQFETFDWKPKLRDMFDEDLPDSVVNGQRFTTMTSGQARFPIAPSAYDFERCGEAGTWISELLPWHKKMADDITVIRSVHTDAINHDPAITFIQTGSEQPGRPSLGSWLSYGLGTPNRDLPGFVVMTPRWTGRGDAQALYNRLWSAGFLPARHNGVALRSAGDPVLYLSNPPGVDADLRRKQLDRLAWLNEQTHDRVGDPETLARIDQYEMAYRMQTSVPELVDLGQERESVLSLYGPEAKNPGTFAHSCVLARRLVERGVPCIQIFIRGWDQHGNLRGDMPNACRDIDQPSYGLIQDLKQRGLLDQTLVVWGGEFGRTTYCQGALSKQNYGRDHHPRCYSMWMAGGGIKAGFNYGETDDFSYNIVKDPVSIHDLNATILHQLGFDHERLTARFQGRDFRLTDVHGRVVNEILA
ncbi:MAG: DUF1501 domain-containing protein [Planctomycetes bacterium]|jgi:hypothetical protein|nr:DUF1501 domain-containing protein [Planctomycetota bacterium]